jgi:hypothetical protein
LLISLSALLKLPCKAKPYQFEVQSGTSSFARSLTEKINKAASHVAFLLQLQSSLDRERILKLGKMFSVKSIEDCLKNISEENLKPIKFAIFGREDE